MNRHGISLLLLGLVTGELPATEPELGPGAWRGTWRSPAAEAPTVSWSVQGRWAEPGAALRLAAEAPDALALDLTLTLPRESGAPGAWHLPNGWVRLGLWRTTLARWWPSWPAGLTVDGEMQATGQGPWPLAAEPTLGVTAAVALSGVEGVWPEFDLELREGVIEARLEAGGTGRAQVAFAAGRFGDWSLGTTRVQLERAAATAPWWLVEGGTEIAGGRLDILPLAWEPGEAGLAMRWRLHGVDLAALRSLWGEVLREAEGRVEGEIELNWSPAGGWSLAAGRLHLMEAQAAHVYLRANPGMLTAELPADHPARAPLQRIELGQTALAVKRLEVVLRRDGPTDEIPLRLRLEAEPLDPGIIAPIILDVNVRGAIEELLALGGLGGR